MSKKEFIEKKFYKNNENGLPMYKCGFDSSKQSCFTGIIGFMLECH